MLSVLKLKLLVHFQAKASTNLEQPSKDGGFSSLIGTKWSNDNSKECFEENRSLIEEQQTKSTRNLLTCHFKAIIEEIVQIPAKSFKPDIVLFKDLVGLTRDLWECRHFKANIKTCIFQKAVDAFKKAVSLIKIVLTYDAWYIRLRNNIEECIGLGQSDHDKFVEVLSKKSVKCR